MVQDSIVICIPTYRRPIGLERCLRSIESQNVGRQVRIVVGDNDADAKEGLAVCEKLGEQGYSLPISAILVKERGISSNRNAIVAEALREGDAEFLVMIDDDEWAQPKWLQQLLDVQARFGADIVGGPVRREFETALSAYASNADLPNYEAMTTGPVGSIDATHNTLFRASLFVELPRPWFDLQFSLTGGEDRDIMTRFALAGCKFAWAGDAWVTEYMPASRCSEAWMLKRGFRAGNSDMAINMKLHPPGYSMPKELIKISGALVVSAVKSILFFWQPERRFGGYYLGARALGKLACILGYSHQEYKVTHGG